MKKIIYCLSALFVGTGYVSAQTNYFVAPNGNNANAGTQTAPWLTVQHGLNQLAAGDTLNLLTGIYTEKVTIPISGITLRAASGQSPVLDATGLTAQVPVIAVSGKSNVWIHGLEVRNNAMTDAQGILVDGAGQNITISNCNINNIHFSSNPNAPVTASTNAQGIIVYGTDPNTAITNLRIMNNELSNCRLGYSEGIAVNGNVDGFEVSANTVHDLTNIGIDAIGHEGTCSNPANDQARNGVIRNNVIYNCVSAYATSGGIYVDGGRDLIIENNTSYHNGYGIEVGCENLNKITSNIIVRNNVIYDCEIAGIALGGFDYPAGSGKVTGSTVRNNTFYANGYDAANGAGEMYLSYSEGSVIENNVFYMRTGDLLVYADLSQPQLQFNYNVFYGPGGASSLNATWNGNSYTGYTAFVSGSSTNANSVFTSPQFVNVSLVQPDFHLLATSPCISAGNPSFVAAPGETDMDAENRVSGIVDCGADEYYPTTDVLLPASSAVSVYPNPAQDRLYVELTGSGIASVFDLSGKLMFSQQVNAAVNSFDVSWLSPGVYLLSLRYGQHVVTTRFVVE